MMTIIIVTMIMVYNMWVGVWVWMCKIVWCSSVKQSSFSSIWWYRVELDYSKKVPAIVGVDVVFLLVIVTGTLRPC